MFQVLVTAGPTRAYLDDVRFISNYSTGELGFEICKALKKRGCKVTAIVGQSACDFEALKLDRVVRIETNREMLGAALRAGRETRPQYAIFSAAVLDFVPRNTMSGKVSSKNRQWTVHLVRAPKIVRQFRKQFPRTEIIEFKLEAGKCSARSGMAAVSAVSKGRAILRKHGSLAICVNSLHTIRAGRHPATLIRRDGVVKKLGTKQAIAKAIAELIGTR